MFLRHVVHLLLAVLLLSQHAGLTHIVTHLAADITAHQEGTSRTGDDKHLPGSRQCAECLTFVGLGSPLPATPPALFPTAPLWRTLSDSPAAAELPATLRSFDSRAPPAVL